LLFKVVHAYGFTPHDREDLFQEIATQILEFDPAFSRRVGRHDLALTA